ncbi:MAG: IPT/TIG domain-containing protein [Acidobacteriia bacterium]|nr:IPT/TIG domain-containing protein [Terriglobia bacterium]
MTTRGSRSFASAVVCLILSAVSFAAPSITSLSPTSGAVGASVTITGTNFGTTQGSSTVKFNTTTVTSITSWGATSIVAIVPTGATTGNVVVTVSGIASNGVSFTVVGAPSITSLSPTSGAVGAAVTVTGTNFGATQGSSTVKFNGTTASVTSWSATSIRTTVPTGATTGNVVVHASGVDSNGSNFTVFPSISSLSPTSGAVGASVTITGANFGSTQGSSTVKFNTTTVTSITSWGATSIVATVPTGAATGSVVVTVGGHASNGVTFTVVAAPNITSLSPTSGAVGAAVTVTGTNFGATQGSSTVKFNGTTASVTSWSATSIKVTVPTGATTGNVVVHASGVDSNGVTFTVFPSISSLSPTSGAVGASVTITGLNFGSTQGSSTLKFNGTPATTISSWGLTSIVATVPSGATTGNVVVTVGGNASNGVSFTVLPTPSISSLSPTTGAVGASVTISGSNFGSTQGTGSLSFNGTAATAIASWGAASIVATVPTGATTGNVVVNVSGVNSNGVSFTVVPAPSITSLSPTTGAVGASVTISGSNFGSAQGTGSVKFNGTTATTIGSWSATTIVATVPTGATTGNVVVNASGVTSNGVSFTVVAAPSVTSLSPTTAVVSTAVTISGSNFGSTQGTGSVTFNGTAATSITSWSATSIVTAVPAGATTGNVVVYASGVNSNGVSFTVNPSISSLSPTSGAVGASVTIAGNSFGSTQGSGTVSFNGTPATSITSWSATSIVTAVPTGATTGNVMVNAGGVNTNGVTFTVIPTPTITSLSTTTGAVGVAVTISGSNFGSTQGTSTVTFNGTTATTITNWSATLIVAVVPAGATSGNVVVSVNGVVSNGINFTVEGLPNITSISPSSGMVGTFVTIAGANFGPTQETNTVWLNSSSAAIASWSDTSIVAIVPSGASSGPFTVTVDGQNASSTSFTVTSLPTGWSDSDIGTVGLTGSASYSNGVFTVKGAGTSVGGTADGMNFMYQSLTGDGSIIARVASVQGGTSFPQVGVMIRETLAQNSTEAFVHFVPYSGYFVYRTTTGGSAGGNSNGFNNQSAPYWVKLVRSGNVFSSYVSSDGRFWTQIGSNTTVSMASAVFVGLGVSSEITSVLETATFDYVSVNSATAPAPVITNTSATTGSIGSEVTITGTNFGVTQNSSQVILNGAPMTIDSWSNTSIVFTIADGATSGQLLVSVAPSMNDSNEVTFEVTDNPLPSAWLDQDVGNVIAPGSSTYSHGTFTVAGAGTIGSTADAFHFTYLPLVGDGSITARVSGLQGPSYPQVGVMIRETTDQSSTFGFVYYYPNQCYFSSRATTGAATTTTTGSLAVGNYPYWVRLVRSGSVFTAYSSPDGFNWNQAGTSTTITMGTNAFIGLVSTNGLLETATFDNVSVGSSTSPAPVITALSATMGSIGSSVTITGNNFGATQNGSFVLLNDAPVTINSWSNTSINFTIPVGATTGFLVVTVAPSMDNSNPVSFAVTSQPVPTGWLNGDFGVVYVAGSTTYVNDVFTVKGGGGVGSTADGLQFVYQPLSGDGFIVAHVTSLSGYSYPQAGVMIRESLDPSSTMAFVYYYPNQAYFYDRPTTGASITSQTAGVGASAYPYWVKLVRSGNNFTAYISIDAFNWTQVGNTVTIAMATNVYIGLTATGANSGYLETATFDSVSIDSASAPAPVITSLSSTTGVVGSQVSITGSNFGTVQGPSLVRLNGTTVTINQWSNTSIVFTIPTGATSGLVTVSVAPNMNDSNPIYFAVTSQALPQSWLDLDIGQLSGVTGSSTYSSGTFTVKGGGAIGGTADAFHFAYQLLAGDGSITARVATLSGATFPEVGVMIRETLSASSTNAFVYFYPNQAYFAFRSSTGGSTTTQPTSFGSAASPYWVRLIRNGNSFTGYISADGTSWTQVGSTQTITMATNVYMGFAVSGGNGGLESATFDNALATAGSTPFISGLGPIIGGVGTPVTIVGSNFGNTQSGSAVKFNGATATSISSWSGNQIVAVVPSSVTSGPGPVTVTVNSIVSNANVNFTAVNPVIASLSPSSGAPGGTVFVNGTGFGAWNGQVNFNGVNAYILSWTDTTIKVWVPAGATTGPVTIVESGVTSAGVQFTVEGPPTITGISPTVGGVGSPVTITGTGFGATQGSSITSINGFSTATASWSDTEIVAYVPMGGVSGPVGATVAGLSTEGPFFTVSNTVYLTDSLTNQTVYTTQDVGGGWNITQVQGPGCSTCTYRGNATMSYDGSGNMATREDANYHATTYTWDNNSNMLSKSGQSDAGTVTFSYTYNNFGEVLTMTDPLNNVTTNTYDPHGNLLTVTTPSPDGGTTPGALTQFTYDTKGELIQITDPLNHVTKLTYNPQGLIASIIDAQNHTTTYGYDLRGNRTSVIDPVNGSAHPTLFSYDPMNHLTGIVYPDGSSVSFGHDVRGRRTSATDQNNRTATYTYDDADRLVAVTDPANNTTQYGYDTESHLKSITDANQHTTYFDYDTQGRMTKTTFPSTLFETFGYDGGGNLTSKTDRKNQTIQYVYDAMNRLTSKTYPDSTAVDYVYDLAGKIQQVSDPSGTYSYSYDNMGRMIGTTTTYSFLPGHNFQNTYTYDAASNRTSITAPDNSITTYGYDTLNRLNGMANSWAGSFGFSYDALSRRTQLTRPNGISTNYTYDAVSHLLSVLHQQASTTLDGASYTYDAAGNRQTKTNYLNTVTSNYGYDPLYQLLQVTQGGSTTESYTYDPVGNRLSSLGAPNYSYDSSNELMSNSNGSYTYDNNGNTLTDPEGRSYTWDFENRLVQAVVPGQNGGTTTFKYDPFGRRIQKSGPLGTTNYLHDRASIVEEIDNTGNVLARYTQAKDIDQPLAQLRSGTTSYYQQDGLGSITSLSNSASALAETYTYDSYGRLTASTGALTNSFQYTGREFDSETSLLFNRARYFDPGAGRFLSPDPIRYGGGVNFYAYTRNNPVVRIDPFGYSDGVCNNPAYCVPGSPIVGSIYLGPDGVWYNDGPPPDGGPAPNPPDPDKGCDQPGSQPPNQPPPDQPPPDQPPPDQPPISCDNWLENEGKEIDARSWEEVKRELIKFGGEQATEKAAEYFEMKMLKKLLPIVGLANYASLMHDLWEIQEEVSAKYQHCH